MDAEDRIVVVTGLPRSGTSLAMQMLAAGGVPPMTDDERRPDDDNPRGYYEFERVKQLRTDKAWLGAARGRAVKVIHMLLTELPDDRPYSVLFMRRDIGEVVRSQAVMLERSGRSGAAMPPDRLASVYEQQLAGVDRWLAARPCFRVLDVPYAELISDPRPWPARIGQLVGRELDAEAMVAAVDPTLYRNRST